MNNQQIRHMVDRFLGWEIPDFHPDGGITFNRIPNHKATGTNLFSAQEAEVMIRHMIEGLPTPITNEDNLK